MAQPESQSFAEKLSALIGQEMNRLSATAAPKVDHGVHVLEAVQDMQKKNEKFQEQILNELQDLKASIGALIVALEDQLNSTDARAVLP